MLELHRTKKFDKDYVLMKKRGYNLTLLKDIVSKLQIPKKLPQKNKAHNLVGNFADFRECHILPDWLLIYQQTETKLILVRTGTHSDLF